MMELYLFFFINCKADPSDEFLKIPPHHFPTIMFCSAFWQSLMPIFIVVIDFASAEHRNFLDIDLFVRSNLNYSLGTP